MRLGLLVGIVVLREHHVRVLVIALQLNRDVMVVLGLVFAACSGPSPVSGPAALAREATVRAAQVHGVGDQFAAAGLDGVGEGDVPAASAGAVGVEPSRGDPVVDGRAGALQEAGRLHHQGARGGQGGDDQPGSPRGAHQVVGGEPALEAEEVAKERLLQPADQSRGWLS